MMTEFLLAHAAALFFATWSVIIFTVSIAAFAPKLLPSKAALDPSPKRNCSAPRRFNLR